MRAVLLFIILLLARSSPGAAQPPDPHNDITRTRCLECHEALPFRDASLRFKDTSDRACLRCHALDGRTSHPVGVRVSRRLPADMPVSTDGRLLCITCHTFHTSSYLPVFKKRVRLRRTVMGRAFCASCHSGDSPVQTEQDELRGP